mmetsp:Transcript_17092/g.37388  ORF Transcript_17092/g.37388 Transcript_17092/m.37388 type:complete len:318 (+) Transcript_17092:575-1528(+)
MFACGALLATTFFILFPESYNIVSGEFGGGGHGNHGREDRRILEEHGNEHSEGAATWRWGSAIMGGFWIPLFLHACFPHDHDHNHGSNSKGIRDNTGTSNSNSNSNGTSNGNEPDCTDAHHREGDTTENNTKTNTKTNTTSTTHADADVDADDFVTLCGVIRLKNVPLFVSYNLGEIFHNFTDGIFVGVAFLGCGRDIQISIVLATIFHELPNQLAGYLVMVNQCGMNPFVALLVNFVFGLSVLVGALLIFVVDFRQVTVGCLLAVGGGTFLHVAISELLGNAEKFKTERVHTVYMFVAFLVGAIPIGLILLNHEHC